MRQGIASLKGTRLSPQQERMCKALQFLMRLIVLSSPLYLVMWLGVDLYTLQLAAASQSSWLLHASGYQVAQQGTGLLVNSSFEFFIIPDCTGWKSMVFLFALIFAVPKVAISRRMWGLVMGLPLIWAVNLARIYGVVLAQGVWGTETAMLIHDTVFQLGLIAIVIGIWIAWLRWPESMSFRNVRKYISSSATSLHQR